MSTFFSRFLNKRYKFAFKDFTRNAVIIVLILVIISACSTPAGHDPVTISPYPIQPYIDANASKSTAVAAVATAEYFSSHLTATVEARNQFATQQALAIQSTQQAMNILGTERAWNATATADSIQATSMAAGTASAVAQQSIWTKRAMDITATANAASVQAYATQQYSLARSEELSIQRKEPMNNVAAVVPWTLLMGSFVVILLVFLRWSRVRIIQRDPRGDAPLLLDKTQGDSILNALKAYKGEHTFTTSKGTYKITIHKLKVLAQPVGAYADWLLDDELRVRKNGRQAEVAVLDIGMNTIDLYVIQDGNVLPRFIGGEKVGVRRLLEILNSNGYEPEELDAPIRAGKISPTRDQLDSWLSEIPASIERTWPNLRRWSRDMLYLH